MPRSEEECRRIIEEENRQPFLPWMTVGEFSALSERQKSRELQKYTQYFTTYLGFWKTCDLSSCRRAKACKGFLTEAQYRAEPGYHDSFPPCVGPGGARQPEVLACIGQLGGEEEDEPKYDGRRGMDVE
ncbi:hypothetical protein [Rhizobium sp. LCM 4573]|uniref:hypothetical protein n=1 Tax=Rhizobium sp. LCM 4573 TaxID=1848291 RepID=UPI0008D8DAB3|nr:hypothetical protein [Rhizobium sp. LCM 4573]OHV77388.1 hypothetical protein LCM4573_07730 [Rhizobium sp. LCM 4573]OHV79102.1 hypothetical protein LCM4573_07725 [Rhizobium sp. LCM 4573]